jgi:DNA invertase Pin-like site-specific DNA recombinase
MSTDNQEESIPQQQGVMRPKAERAGIDIVREFADEGVTGGRMGKRNALEEMLTYCQEQYRQGQPIEAIVCWDTKRFSRASSIETNHYIWAFMQVGVYRLFTYSDEWIDFRKEEHRVLFNLRQDISNNRDLRDRSKDIVRGKVEHAREGYWNGSVAPYGFDRMLVNQNDEPVRRLKRGEKVFIKEDGYNVVLVPTDDPEILEVIRWLFHQYADTETSYRALAMSLNQRGVPGPGSGLTVRKKGNGRAAQTRGMTGWSTGVVKRILSSPVYVGDYRYGLRACGTYHRFVDGEIREADPTQPSGVNSAPLILNDNHDGIIDRKTWETVQRKAKERSAGKRRPRATGMALSGLAYCGRCGWRLYGESHRHRRYYCCSRSKTQPGTCPYETVREDLLLSAIVRKLQEVYLAPKRIEGLRQALRKRIEECHGVEPREGERLRGRLAELDQDIKQGAKNLVRATENLDLIQQELTALRLEREEVQRQLDQLLSEPPVSPEELAQQVEAAIARLGTLREHLGNAKPERLRAVLHLLVTRIDVYWDEPRRTPGRKFSVFGRGVFKVRPFSEVSECVALASTAPPEGWTASRS